MNPSCLVLDAFVLGDLARLHVLDRALGIGIPIMITPLVREAVIKLGLPDPCRPTERRAIVVNQAAISDTLALMRKHGLLMHEAAAVALSQSAEGALLVARTSLGKTGMRWLAAQLESQGVAIRTMLLLKARWGLATTFSVVADVKSESA